MYKIKKVRRKLLIGNEYKVCTLWQCICKFGTHGSTPMLLFDEPKTGIFTTGIKEADGKYSTQYSLVIDEVREEDNFIFLSLM